MNWGLILLEDAGWSAIAASGFAVLFNVPPRTLFGCAVCGAVGHAVRTGLIEGWQATLPFATFVGAMMVGFLGRYFARRHTAPTPIFTVSGVIPMVPGVFAYRTMLGIFEITTTDSETANQILVNTAVSGITVGLILAAIVGGSIIPQLLFDRRKPVV